MSSGSSRTVFSQPGERERQDGSHESWGHRRCFQGWSTPLPWPSVDRRPLGRSALAAMRRSRDPRAAIQPAPLPHVAVAARGASRAALPERQEFGSGMAAGLRRFSFAADRFRPGSGPCPNPTALRRPHLRHHRLPCRVHLVEVVQQLRHRSHDCGDDDDSDDDPEEGRHFYRGSGVKGQSQAGTGSGIEGQEQVSS
jgi:hypothetical protein